MTHFMDENQNGEADPESRVEERPVNSPKSEEAENKFALAKGVVSSLNRRAKRTENFSILNTSVETDSARA